MTATMNLLMGMRLIAVQEALVPCGFSDETLTLGWSLLERVGRSRAIGNAPLLGGQVRALAEYKKRWFPVARTALRRRRPELVPQLLGYQNAGGGLAPTILVPTFLRELRKLEASSDPLDRETFALLRTRGLTEEVLRDGESRVAEYQRLDLSIPFESLRSTEERAATELWDFYLEWSDLCRQNIQSRTWLRALGLTGERRGRRTAQKPPAPTVSVQVAARAPKAELLPSEKNRKKYLGAATPEGPVRKSP